MRPTLSFAICVHNEHEELKRLLDQLIPALEPEDEIVIQGDQGKVTEEVVSIIHSALKNSAISYIEYPLKKDFSAFKNNLFKNCSKDWIFMIDADEFLGENLLYVIKDLILINPDVDCYAVPRINTVEGIDDNYIRQMRWRKDRLFNLDVINFPDHQFRILKNNGEIRYQNKVHEVLHGQKMLALIPDDSLEWCLMHPKSFEKQLSQNQFYKTIQ